MKKLLYITNIPAPYRQKRFNTMAQIFPKYGIDFEVLYMAKIEPNRQWKIPEDSYQYKYKIFKGIHPTISNFFAHFNPGLLNRLKKNDYDIAVIGGMASPTHWFAPFFISRKKFKIMSIESNLFSVRRKKGLAAWFKSFLLSRADAFQVTGQPQIDYIQYFQPKSLDKPFIKLPNLVDEEVFIKKVDKLRVNKYRLRDEFGVSEKDQIWVLPAMLIQLKGIVPFIQSLKGLTGFRLFILGEGNLRNQITEIIEKEDLPVTLVGFVQQNEVIRYYAAADLFILPSFRDASPLSVIEALAASLPIFVSKNIGNINEVLNEDNGLSFEPGNINEIRMNAKTLLTMTRTDLLAKGAASRQQYLNVFETETCIRNYAVQILNAINNE